MAVASRSLDKLTPLALSIGATPFTVDCGSTASVVALFTTVETQMGGPPDVVLYNTGAGFNHGGECGTLSYDGIDESMQISAISAFVATPMLVLNTQGQEGRNSADAPMPLRKRQWR